MDEIDFSGHRKLMCVAMKFATLLSRKRLQVGLHDGIYADISENIRSCELLTVSNVSYVGIVVCVFDCDIISIIYTVNGTEKA